MTTIKKSSWTIGSKGLKTKWADEITPENAWQHYPRPQLEREEWVNLNGLWDYCILSKEQTLELEHFQADGQILVPFPVESALSGVQRELLPEEKIWYQRSFTIPKDWDDKRIILHFGAVDWECKVWLNGQFIGEHLGGYCPFSFDITDSCNDINNELLVSVWDPTDQGLQERGKQSLAPQGLFYSAVSGIWQTVWLEPVSPAGIAAIKCTPYIDTRQIAIQLQSMLPVEGNYRVNIRIYDKGNTVISQCLDYLSTQQWQCFTFTLHDMKLWTPSQPHLYNLHIEIFQEDICIDRINSYFAMRHCSIERDEHGVKRLCLNYEPLFQNGVLDQGYWPDGLYTAPCDDALKYDIETMKQLGFNMIRKHIKIEPARWYYHCDHIGMLVWQDMVNGGKRWDVWNQVVIPNVASTWRRSDYKISSYARYGRSDKENREQFRKELKEMIDQLYHFPSIILWSPFNEAWGQFDAADIGNWVQSYDPSRLVDHASGWYDQNYGEIKSIHTYFRRLSMPRNVRDRAIVISEYGGYNYLIPQHSEQMLREAGYKRCKSYEELCTSYQKLIHKQLMPLIEKGISAAVYTQLSDVEGEVNGIITYDRKVVKFDEKEMQALHHDLYESCDKEGE